ncbi:hypothetical protein T4B_7893 [Trichinella pseudospiralis]|uniref:Uncharacterized protein n=1 Tax=Trichinella pseudospiralis TaxID=6337 RepID=A0A0V1EYU2_TRIPS|nr:hypothetical protein T4A_10015 [Trichinella pseudospiralis]KRZ34767.1 hypothetical protein T4B_7893 [Trichinella pseudospiralis]KRZ45994.1 hypothetical protein T4C_780 [Trichinella pseudospiralis]
MLVLTHQCTSPRLTLFNADIGQLALRLFCFRNEPKFYSPWNRVAKPPTSYWSNVANSGSTS